MKALELKIPPPIAAVLFGLAMWWTAHLLPAVYLADQLRVTIAVVCAGLGFIVAFLGFLAFRQAKTTISPANPQAASSVVTSGVFSREIPCTSG